MKNYVDARVKELIGLGASFKEAHEAALDEWKAMHTPGRKATGKKAPEAKELVEFTKHDGTKVMCTPKQAAAWEAYRSRSNGKTLDEVKAEWEEAHKNFKPSKELKDALKAKPTMTRKEAAALGFIGTKDELKALKAKLKVYDK